MRSHSLSTSVDVADVIFQRSQSSSVGYTDATKYRFADNRSAPDRRVKEVGLGTAVDMTDVKYGHVSRKATPTATPMPCSNIGIIPTNKIIHAPFAA